MRASANVSYQNSAEDVTRYTGISVKAKTQQRLVHRYEFPETISSQEVAQISVDGGKVRLRTAKLGESCIWQDYKAVNLDSQISMAWFHENEALINSINQQPLASNLYCIGDGHQGIWNLVNQFNPQGKNTEILDWFHLVENLHKVGGSIKRLNQGENLLWHGKVNETITLFSSLQNQRAQNFYSYLHNHAHRIVNYAYYQAENISSIASGSVESTVKQIGQRLKISGAQWNRENIPQILKHRCAYLNKTLFA